MNYEPYAAPVAVPPMGGIFAPPEEEYDPFDLPEGEEMTVEAEEPVPSGLVQLYDYQERAVNAILAEHQNVTGTLCVSATGTGKSIMMAELIRRYVAAGHKVLILVHRDELIRQLCRSMGRVGLPVLVEKADEKALAGFGTLADVVCASVQTMRNARLEQWPQDSFGLIVIDEAHHSQAASYLTVLRHFGWRNGRGAPQPYLCGFTATADRLDGKNVGAVFDSLAFEYNLRQAVIEGRLVKPVSITLDTDPPIDLRDLRTTAGDFNAGDLEQVIAASLNQIVNAIADDGRLGSRKAIGFTPDISSARAMAAALSKVGITADYVSGACKNRDEKLKAHQRGDYQVLMNCMLATEGYDDPEIAAVLLCRPTKSRGLLSQMVGRGTRLCPSIGKTDCLLIDFNYLTRTHDLAAGVDLFDDNSVSDEVLSIARELIENEGGGDLEEALARAETINAARVKERIQRQLIPMKAGNFDPLGIAEFFDIPIHKEAYDWQNVRVATDHQLAALQKFGVAVSTDLPFIHAKKMLDVLISRSQHGWTTMRQINALMESGLDPDTARGMRKTEAAKYLDSNPLPPSDKQKKMLRWKGVPDSEIAIMTRKEASARIDALMKN
jgi:superfamily II DNA or RNA helicase